jgi:hypothetical protein
MRLLAEKLEGATAWNDFGALLLLTKRSNERRVALALKRQGITDVRPLAGGLEGWLERGISRCVERALTAPSQPLNDEDCHPPTQEHAHPRISQSVHQRLP